MLKQSDTTLSAITDQLQRASELTVQARNGTLNDAARKAIGVEIASIVDSIASLANKSALSALRGPLTSTRVNWPLTRNDQVADSGMRLSVRHE